MFWLEGEGEGESLGVEAFFVGDSDVGGELQFVDMDGVLGHGASCGGVSFRILPPQERIRAFAPADSASWIFPART